MLNYFYNIKYRGNFSEIQNYMSPKLVYLKVIFITAIKYTLEINKNPGRESQILLSIGIEFLFRIMTCQGLSFLSAKNGTCDQ